ncbi:MAG: hypothetical protein JWN94_4471 [Betaproteobacteria bacterium]|nr:hypothetical protein [Betaproteobacteria bacterium]
MASPKIFTVLLSGLLISGAALADQADDGALQQRLVGSWVLPPDAETDALRIPSRQVFNRDGTTQLYLYTTPECRSPAAAAIEGRWSIENSVLTTQITAVSDSRLIPVGEVQKVVIVALEDDKVVFHADDKLFVREKSETCFPPDAHRT